MRFSKPPGATGAKVQKLGGIIKRKVLRMVVNGTSIMLIAFIRLKTLTPTLVHSMEKIVVFTPRGPIQKSLPSTISLRSMRCTL